MGLPCLHARRGDDANAHQKHSDENVVSPQVERKQGRQEQVGEGGEKNIAPGTPAMHRVHILGDQVRVSQVLDRPGKSLPVGKALLLQLPHLLFQVGLELKHNLFIGMGVQLQLVRDALEVALEFRFQSPSPWGGLLGLRQHYGVDG